MLLQTAPIVNVGKWSKKKLLAVDLGKRMSAAGLQKRGERMSVCASYIIAETCEDCGTVHVTSTNFCRDKLCPVCSWRLGLMRMQNMALVVTALQNAYPESEWSFFTVTVQNCPVGKLADTMKVMSKAWNRLLQRAIWRDNVKGWARSVEVTYNLQQDTVHPHFHTLIMWEGKEPPEAEQLRYAWMEVCPLDTDIKAQDIRKISLEQDFAERQKINRAIIETFKYTQKSSDLMRMPVSTLRKYALQVSGKRMVSFGGVVKEYKRLLQLEFEEIEETGRSQCVECSSRDLARALYRWSFAACGYVPESLDI